MQEVLKLTNKEVHDFYKAQRKNGISKIEIAKKLHIELRTLEEVLYEYRTWKK